MLVLCSTGRACLGMLLVDIISGQRYYMNFGKAAAVSLPSSGNTLKYNVIVCIVVVVIHMWGRLIVVQVVRYSAFKIA